MVERMRNVVQQRRREPVVVRPVPMPMVRSIPILVARVGVVAPLVE